MIFRQGFAVTFLEGIWEILFNVSNTINIHIKFDRIVNDKSNWEITNFVFYSKKKKLPITKNGSTKFDFFIEFKRKNKKIKDFVPKFYSYNTK